MTSSSRTTAILIAVSLAAAVAIFAQGRGGQAPQQGGAQGQAQPAQPPGIVTGSVVNAKTSEPLRKVLLTLRPSGRGGGGQASGSSDNSGNFRIQGVQPGTYTLTGNRTGFVSGAYGEDQAGGEARTIEVM